MHTPGATGAAASKEQKPADDAADDASSCPELMSDDDPMPALPGMKPASRRFNGVEEADDDTDDEAGSEGAKQSNRVLRSPKCSGFLGIIMLPAVASRYGQSTPLFMSNSPLRTVFCNLDGSRNLPAARDAVGSDQPSCSRYARVWQ